MGVCVHVRVGAWVCGFVGGSGYECGYRYGCVCIIGTSLSEPHTYRVVLQNPLFTSRIYVSMVRRSIWSSCVPV